MIRRNRALDGLDQDIHNHIEHETQDNIERGMAPQEARRQARLKFGNVALAKEDTRRVWVSAWLDEACQDFSYAARILRKSRSFSITAFATLALAIGANTAMFSVLNAVLLRPLPYRSPEQLAMLWTEDPTQNLREGRSALWDVEQWRGQSQTFADMATFDSVTTTLTGAEGAEQIVGVSISPNLLTLLGVQPVRGRNFSNEETEEQKRLVLISHRFWQARFGGSNDAIGATLVLNGLPSIVMGIFAWEFLVRPIGHFSALAGGAAIGAMMIPLVTRTTEEMVRTVPQSLREAALALGFPRWRTSLQIVLRTAMGGIVTGVLVAVARVAGETAPLLFTAFGNQFFSTKLTQPIAALPLQVFTYAISPYDEWHAQAWAGALVLITLVLVISVISRFVVRSKHGRAND